MLRRRFLAAGTLVLLGAGAVRANESLYPAPSGPPGAPFPDPNFKLAVMSALLDKGVLDLGTRRAFAEHVLGRPFDLEREGYAPIPGARDYLVRYPLSKEMLEAVDHLVLDGGDSIYFYIWSFWHGEDDTFDVQSLAGIENCPNIVKLEIVSMIPSVDLGILAPLRRLEDIAIGVPVSTVEALLDLPALRSVEFLDDDLYDAVTTPGHPVRAVMEALKARGVSVWVHWVAWSGDGPPPPAYR